MILPADTSVRRLASLYETADLQLQALIADAIDRGADGTAAYYTRQLAEVRRVLVEVQTQAIPLATEVVGSAYVSGVRYADNALGLSGSFAGVHTDAINVIADNTANKLNEAAATVGRQTEDVFRKVALGDVGLGIATGATREMTSRAIRENLIREGATAFRDKAGRRWSLSSYTSMVARTTTREAISIGTANRLLQNGHDLVTITTHSHGIDECSDYEGKTFSLTGDSSYPMLDRYPPFHPNCVHVLTPAEASFDQFEKAVTEDASTPDEVKVEQPAAVEPLRYTAADAPKKGASIRFADGIDAVTGKPVAGGKAKIIEVKGEKVMLNAGTSTKPKWIQTTLAKIERAAPTKRVEAVKTMPLPKPFDGKVITSKELRDHLGHDRGILDKEAKKALKRYSGNDFYDLNNQLRRGRVPALASDLDRAFAQVAPTTEPSIVFRGTQLNRVKGLKVEEGHVMTEKGFSSTTVRKSVGESFSDKGGDLLEIECPKGTRMLDVNRLSGSEHGGESEILLPRGVRFVITSIKAKKDGGRIVRARLIPND